MAKKSIFSRKITAPTIKTRSRLNASAEDIQKLAYYMWEKDGRPEGKDWDFWFRAEKQLYSFTK